MDTASLDAQLALLKANKERWIQLPISQKRAYLETIVTIVPTIAAEWVEVANEEKRLPKNSPWNADEWTSGPWATAHWSQSMIRTLKCLEAGKPGQFQASKVRQRPDGQVVVDVAPNDWSDHIIMSGMHAEVWMQSEITSENIEDSVAVTFKHPPMQGKIALILGAGNISSIPILDALYKLMADWEVCLLKMNPVNEYLEPIFQRLFKPLIDDGFLQLCVGGADVGNYLVNHPDVDTIHITGSVNSYNAIVFGTGEEGAKRKAESKPLLKKPITSELGNVSPTIVVPGSWEEADLKYHAQHIATHAYHNAGYNCLGTQLLILPNEWKSSSSLVDELREHLKQTPNRYSYYPGTEQRHAQLLELFPDAELYAGNGHGEEFLPRVFIPDVPADEPHSSVFKQEYFCNMLASTSLPGKTAADYLRHVVEFCNETLMGTLSANILIHPSTIKELGPMFEETVAQLRYGGIGINVWSGGSFLLAQAGWGAYPGETVETAVSGLGFVHNTFLFDKPQKTVLYGGFYPFPRNLMRGEFHILPKPIWFLSHKHAAQAAEHIVDFESTRSLISLLKAVWFALRG